MADVFTRFFSREFEVSPTAVTQHFAGDLCRLIDADNGYCLTFGPDKGPACGFVAISPQTAMAWVIVAAGRHRVRRRSESAAVLSRRIAAVRPGDGGARSVPGLAATARDPQERRPAPARASPPSSSSGPKRSAESRSRSRRPARTRPPTITFVLPCSRLAALVGKTPAAAPRATPQELSQTLMEHLQQMPVTVTVATRLDHARVPGDPGSRPGRHPAARQADPGHGGADHRGPPRLSRSPGPIRGTVRDSHQESQDDAAGRRPDRPHARQTASRIRPKKG